MAYEILMPQLGLTMEEGTVSQWMKHEGDAVKAGDVVAEITTDKLTHELQSEHDGVLLKIVAQEGEDVPVKGVLAYIGEAGESITAAPAAARNQFLLQHPPRQLLLLRTAGAFASRLWPGRPRLSWVLRTLPLSWAAAPLAASPRRISWQPLRL